MRKLVRLRTRPSRDGKTFKYFLDFKDETGRRRHLSLRHADWRKAQRQRDQKERELRMGVTVPESMTLSTFLEDSQRRSQGQVRESTLVERKIAMDHLIQAIGDMDYLKVEHRHGELFLQTCLDKGNSPATVNKKLAGVKRLFQLAVVRGQLETNPFQYVCMRKVPRRKVHVYSDDECNRLIGSAREFFFHSSWTPCVPWDLLVLVALCTGMRRGELLNTTWRNIDFDKRTIDVSAKVDTDQTWEWHVKDTDRRRLPLTEQVLLLLAKHYEGQPEGYPYVFVTPGRYERIQQNREQGKWTVRHGRCPVNNFTRQFKSILACANIDEGEFHDLRRTCLTRWLSNGLSEYDVMTLAGHAKFETTRQFYIAVREDLLDRARAVSTEAMDGDFVAHLLRTPSGSSERT
jgi:integrase